jgi:hypothetical protein
VSTSLSTGCKVIAEVSDTSSIDRRILKGGTDSGGGASQLNGACVVMETAPLADSNNSGGSVWPKAIRRPATGTGLKAHESHLMGGTLRDDPSDDRDPTARKAENQTPTPRNADNVSKLIYGAPDPAAPGHEEHRPSRRQIAHR